MADLDRLAKAAHAAIERLAGKRPTQFRVPTENRVHCNTCDGHGMRPLTAIEREMMGALTDEWQSTADIGKQFPKVKPTALIGRLNSLVALGLAERRRERRDVDWRIAQIKAGQP